MIKLSLEGKAVPNPTGGAKWDISQIRSILGNEKYCGDVLMQKTFTQDCINKKVIKNTGQLPMYLIQNNHPAIVSREIYQAVQAEKTRRSASASPSKRTSSTGRSCYASKFALSERLVCGECGTLYRRCTWKRNGKTRIVWRCVSRLDYGTKYCHQSPTMDEEPLQQTIMAAINSVMDSKGIICSQITEAAVEETGILPNSTMTLGEINRRREELEAEFNILLQQPDSAAKNAVRFGSIANEMTKLRFPNMVHVGDITKLNGAELPPVNIICGGSPCQDLSVAGARAGLAGARSGLFMEQVSEPERRGSGSARCCRCAGRTAGYEAADIYCCWLFRRPRQ